MLRFGTCSWKFPSWVDLVYGRGLVTQKRPSYLKEYARKYSTVEVDQWFWSLFGEDKIALPRSDQIAEYLGAVPKDFSFTVKVSNAVTLTHFYKSVSGKRLIPNPCFYSPTLFADFVAALGDLTDRTHAFIFQFEYLSKQKMSGISEFLDRTAEFLDKTTIPTGAAFEVRNPNYIKEPLFAFFQEHGLIPVLSQGYYLPDIREVYDKFGDYITDRLIIRLLGPDREGIEEDTGKEWNSVVRPKDDELPGIVERTTELLGRGVDVVLNVNNHYEGSAPLTIDKLRAAFFEAGYTAQ